MIPQEGFFDAYQHVPQGKMTSKITRDHNLSFL